MVLRVKKGTIMDKKSYSDDLYFPIKEKLGMKVIYFFRFFLTILFFLNFSIRPYAYAEDVDQDTIARVNELSQQLLTTTHVDPRTKQQAAKDLGDYKYVEVAESLLRAIKVEVEKSKPNTFIIMAAVESLQKMPSFDLVGFLEQIINLFHQREKAYIGFKPTTYMTTDNNLRELRDLFQHADAELGRLQNVERIAERFANREKLTLAEQIAILDPVKKQNAQSFLESLRSGIEANTSDNLIEESRQNQLNFFRAGIRK